jgi:hypothetical protein
MDMFTVVHLTECFNRKTNRYEQKETLVAMFRDENEAISWAKSNLDDYEIYEEAFI